MSVAGEVLKIVAKVLYKVIELSYTIVKFWLKYILPIFLSISFFFYFISSGIAIGLETGIILLFVLITGIIGLYLINGKTLFLKVITKMKNMFFFLDKSEKEMNKDIDKEEKKKDKDKDKDIN